MKSIITQAFLTRSGVFPITVLQGEIPILKPQLTAEPEKLTSVAACAVNFLNAGCPRVKIVLDSHTLVEDMKNSITNLMSNSIHEVSENKNMFTLTVSKKEEKE